MPTRKQLIDTWKAQFQLFAGGGTPMPSNRSITEGHGHTEEHITEVSNSYIDEDDLDDSIGSIEFNETNEELFVKFK
ncbi:MAG: hypothetical protein HRT61_13475 [Ekhidna sp.]|nr:hypothetical protein [Ekhidna sp.]